MCFLCYAFPAIFPKLIHITLSEPQFSSLDIQRFCIRFFNVLFGNVASLRNISLAVDLSYFSHLRISQFATEISNNIPVPYNLFQSQSDKISTKPEYSFPETMQVDYENVFINFYL